MFALHETTQRRVCRVGFLVLCALPVLLTLAAVVYYNRPWRQADWQDTLEQQLHVRAELKEILRPRPGTMVLTQLKLADLRTGSEFGAIESLRLLHRDARLTLHADHLTVEAEQLPALVSAITIWLETHEALPLDFHADRLTIRSPGKQTLELVKFVISSVDGDNAGSNDIDSSAEGQRFGCMAEDAAGEKIQLTLTSQSQALRCWIQTKKSTLPAWLVGKLAPGLSNCGEAKFKGVLEASSIGQQVSGKLKGIFDSVDLQVWVGEACPHRLQGTARLTLEQFSWAAGRIEIMQGSLHSNGGACSLSLLKSAEALCGCEFPLPTEKKLVPYDRLDISFLMDQQGIRFMGSSNGRVLISHLQQPVLLAGKQQLVWPVGRLVRLFNYQEPPGWMPATRRAHALAEKLPLPREQRQ